MSAIQAFRESISAVSPYRCVQQALTLLPNALQISGVPFPLATSSKVAIVAFGKASLAMTAAAEASLEERFLKGVVMAPEGSLSHYNLESTVHYGAKNNFPDVASVSGTERILSFVEECDHSDNIFMFLISGGGSALFCSPDGVSLEEKLSTIRTLVSHGADIQQLNIVRQALSTVKGGRTLSRIKSATVVSLIMSDIVGDPVHLIASGPTVPTVLTLSPLDVFQSLEIPLESLPGSVVKKLLTHRESMIPTVQEDHFVVANNTLALSSIKKFLENDGYSVQLVTSSFCGDATLRGQQFGSLIRADYSNLEGEIQKMIPDFKLTSFSKKLALVLGGETTVKGLGAAGIGGRCQHMVLSCLLELCLGIGPNHKFCFLSAGTDGQDGPTEAAGAYITEKDTNLVDSTIIRDHFSRFDSFNFWRQFNCGNSHVITGKTGTNVMDIQICLLDYDK